MPGTMNPPLSSVSSAPPQARPGEGAAIRFFLKWYRVIINSIIFSWLTIAGITLFTYAPPLGVVFLVLLHINLFLVAYSDCRTCPRRLGRCTHFYVGRLTKLLPEKRPGEKSLGGHALVFTIWGVVQIMPQYWLWQNHRVVLVAFWLLPIAALFFLRAFVCWRACGNKECPMNKQTHPISSKSKGGLGRLPIIQ
jgi:hypothetical protein